MDIVGLLAIEVGRGISVDDCGRMLTVRRITMGVGGHSAGTAGRLTGEGGWVEMQWPAIGAGLGDASWMDADRVAVAVVWRQVGRGRTGLVWRTINLL